MIAITSSTFSVLLAAIVYIIYRRYTRCSIKHIRGPKAPFLLGKVVDVSTALINSQFFLCNVAGNVRDFSYQNNVGDLDFRYAKEYGLVWRMGGALGVR